MAFMKLSIVSLLVIASALWFPINATAEICGQGVATKLIAGQDYHVGHVWVYPVTGENKILVEYTMDGADAGWVLAGDIHLHVAESKLAIPQNGPGNPKLGQFAYGGYLDDPATTWSQEVDISDLRPECGVDDIYIAAYAEVMSPAGDYEGAWAEGERFVPRGNWAMYWTLTLPCCGCSQNRTQTQGGWGTDCHGDNPGCYRDLHFDTLSPLMIGMNSGCSAMFYSSEAINDFLPQGGPPSALNCPGPWIESSILVAFWLRR